MKRFVKEIKDYILTKKLNRYALNKMEACLKLSNHYQIRYLYNAYVYGLDINPNDEVSISMLNDIAITNYYWRKYKAWQKIQISLAEKFLAKDWWIF